MDCPRCSKSMFRTQMFHVEHFGNMVIRSCVSTNECPECGVQIRVFVPSYVLLKGEENDPKLSSL